jgi:hypothetical protein
MYEADKDMIETIAVGSSHGDCGFDPSFFEGSFNLCSSSQDLKRSFALYRHACETAGNLKRVVVFYPVFSPGFFLEKVRSEKEKCPGLNEIFSLGFSYDDPEIESLGKSIRGKLDGLTYDPEPGSCSGFSPRQGKGQFPESYGAERRAVDHMKLNVSNEANVYLMEILLLAKQNGHDVHIVVPPVREDYKAGLAKSFNYLFRDIIDVVGVFSQISPFPKTEVVSYFDDADFRREHFMDFDHLAPTGDGTMLLSTKLRDHILIH